MATELCDGGPAEFFSLSRLHEIGVACAHEGTLTELLGELLTTVITVTMADFGRVELLDPTTHRLSIRVDRGFSPDLLIFFDANPDRRSPSMAAITGRSSIVVEDVRTTTVCTEETRRAMLAADVLAWQSTPLLARSGDPLGAVSMYFRTPCRPTDRQLQLVELFIRHAGDFIELNLHRRAMQLLCAREQEAHATADAINRSRDESLAVLAHELRQPLAALLPAMEVHKRSLSAERRQRADEVIEHQIAHLARLVEDLSDVSRISRGNIDLVRERLDLRALVRQALEMATPVLDRRKHATRVTLGTEPVWVTADATRMKQVFSNLLLNSASYTPPGGQVAVSLETRAGHVFFRVRDNGVGIPRQDLGRIFQIFERGEGHTDAPSIGIGLAVVRQLVELHGGTVSVTSGGMGQGSEFLVTLPAAPLPQPPDASSQVCVSAGS